MAKVESLGIRRIESLHYYVRDLERSRAFYTQRLDFAELGGSEPGLEARAKQRSLAFGAGQCTVLVSQPTGPGGAAARFLARHPDGIGSITFEVESAERAFALLERRGGTFLTDLQRAHDDHGSLAWFAITTPFGDTNFRFVERRGYKSLFPGFAAHSAPAGGGNSLGFQHIDHVTSNFRTMAPALLWMEHVLGLEQLWDVTFHTDDVAGARDHGSGLKSRVFWDPASGVRFANNEPLRPHFRASQIALFCDDHRGDGVQHAALAVADILSTVRSLRARDVAFMPTPGAYYDLLPERIQRLGINRIDEDISTLRELEILVDGDRDHSYLLQIFLRDSAGLYREPEAGPFFYEIIQRKGDQGFGAGNFRALFESIERQQKAEGRV